MRIFTHAKVTHYLKSVLANAPKNGWGLTTEYAKKIGISPTLMSQVFNGEKSLTTEQAALMAKELGLTELERDYFIFLNEFERAGNSELRQYWKAKYSEVRDKAQQIVNIANPRQKLNEAENAIFYSSYLYTAISLFCSLSKNGKTLEEICSRFELNRQEALKMLNFLLQSGLCLQEKDRYKIGIMSTHLGKDSPFLSKHYQNWHLKAIQSSDRLTETELMYSCPVSISKDDFQELKGQLLKFIQDFLKTVKDSKEEDIACLNLDWFWVKK